MSAFPGFDIATSAKPYSGLDVLSRRAKWVIPSLTASPARSNAHIRNDLLAEPPNYAFTQTPNQRSTQSPIRRLPEAIRRTFARSVVHRFADLLCCRSAVSRNGIITDPLIHRCTYTLKQRGANSRKRGFAYSCIRRCVQSAAPRLACSPIR